MFNVFNRETRRRSCDDCRSKNSYPSIKIVLSLKETGLTKDEVTISSNVCEGNYDGLKEKRTRRRPNFNLGSTSCNLFNPMVHFKEFEEFQFELKFGEVSSQAWIGLIIPRKISNANFRAFFINLFRLWKLLLKRLELKSTKQKLALEICQKKDETLLQVSSLFFFCCFSRFWYSCGQKKKSGSLLGIIAFCIIESIVF